MDSAPSWIPRLTRREIESVTDMAAHIPVEFLFRADPDGWCYSMQKKDQNFLLRTYRVHNATLESIDNAHLAWVKKHAVLICVEVR